MKNKVVKRETKRDRRFFFISVIVFGVTLIVAAIVFTRGSEPTPTPIPIPTAAAERTPNSGIMQLGPEEMTRTAILSTELGDERETLQAMVDACGEYRDERRSQMNQHLIWLEHPDQIPADIQFAFGENPVGRLIYGMASYTSIEWKLKDSPADSCLLPIGRALNVMLVAAGETAFEEFE